MREMGQGKMGIGAHIAGLLFGILWTGVTFFIAKGATEMNSSIEEDGMGMGPFICIPWIMVLFGIALILARVSSELIS